jgi:phosphate starvation-inducible PhoH-like protein
MSKTSRRKLTFDTNDEITLLFKDNKEHPIFAEIQNKYHVELKLNAVGVLVAKGDKESTLELETRFKVLISSTKPPLTLEHLQTVLDDASPAAAAPAEPEWNTIEFKNYHGKISRISPKNDHQREFMEQIVEKKVVFGSGASGTGKTMIAVVVALKMLEIGKIKKLFITRPYLPSENFGFLPGDIDEKMLPFFLPIYNIIDALIGRERRELYQKNNKIEILPAAFARGITIGGFQPEMCIVDESENLTHKQMFLMLSRIGSHPNSKIIFCGDSYQTDLGPRDADSLKRVEMILRGSPYVGFTTFTKEDVVRSVEVQDMVERFEKYEAEQKNKKN